MKKLLLPLSFAAFVAFAVAACAKGETGEPITDDLAVTSTAPDASETTAHLPPRAADDAAATSDGGTSADDDAATDASPADAAADAVATIDASTTVDAAASGACGAGSTQLGEYATWYGKVNVHRATGGTWLVDTDCSSGADVNTVAYCKKFWPASVTQIQLGAVSPDAKPFTSGGGSAPACGGVALAAGQAQFACCVP